MDNIDLSNYVEIKPRSNKVKEVVQTLAYMGCFTVAAPPNKPVKPPYTTLVVNEQALIMYGDRRVFCIDVPGGYSKKDGSLILNWCMPGYIGEGTGPVFMYSSCSTNENKETTVEICSVLDGDTIPNRDELKAYNLKTPERAKPMNINQEIEELKKEVQELKSLLSRKDVSEVREPTTKNQILVSVPKTLGKYYLPSVAPQLISESYENLKYIHTQTEDMCIQAVKVNPYALSYVHHQTPKICNAAIDSDPLALQFVVDQTVDICKRALLKDAAAISFVRVPTLELISFALESGKGKPWGCIAGATLARTAQVDPVPYETFKHLVYQSPHFLAYVPEKMRTEELIKIALDRSTQALAFLEDQKPYMEYAVAKSLSALAYIRNVTPSLYEFALDVHHKPVHHDNITGFNHIPTGHFLYIDLFSVPVVKANMVMKRLGVLQED